MLFILFSFSLSLFLPLSTYYSLYFLFFLSPSHCFFYSLFKSYHSPCLCRSLSPPYLFFLSFTFSSPPSFSSYLTHSPFISFSVFHLFLFFLSLFMLFPIFLSYSLVSPFLFQFLYTFRLYNVLFRL